MKTAFEEILSRRITPDTHIPSHDFLFRWDDRPCFARGELVALRFDDLDGNRLILTDSYSHGTKSLTGRLKDIEGWRTVDVVPPALEIIEKIRQERIRLGLPTDGCIFTVNEKYGSLYSALGKTINKY